MKQQKGSALMEVVLAVSIMGIVTAGVIPNVISLKSHSGNAMAKEIGATLASAQNACYQASQVSSTACTPSTTCAGLSALLVGGTFPSGIDVTDGTTSGCKITYTYDGTAYTLDNFAIQNITTGT